MYVRFLQAAQLGPPAWAAFHEWDTPVEDDLDRLRELADQYRRMTVVSAAHTRNSLHEMADELDSHINGVERERRGLLLWPANDTASGGMFTNRS